MTVSHFREGLGDEPTEGSGFDAAEKRLLDALCKPPGDPHAYASEWKYETDFLLTHVSGLKVSFEEQASDLVAAKDSVAQEVLRSRMLGDFGAGSVLRSRARLMEQGLGEAAAAKSTTRLLRQATHLFRSRPAGTPGAPERMSKAERLAELVGQRRSATWEGYRGIHEFHGGAYDCDNVSPVTKAAGNLDSDIFVLLQDWSSEQSLEGKFDHQAAEFGYTPTEPTFANLSALLRQHFHVALSEVYATNLFPFIKPGNMTQSIPRRDLVRAALEFAIPQIEIVRPKLVICVGLGVFTALQRATGFRLATNLTVAAKIPLHIGGAKIWPQAHTGYYGRMTRNRGDNTRVDRDWAEMANALRQAKE